MGDGTLREEGHATTQIARDRFDQAIGLTLREVTVPDDFKARLLIQLFRSESQPVAETRTQTRTSQAKSRGRRLWLTTAVTTVAAIIVAAIFLPDANIAAKKMPLATFIEEIPDSIVGLESALGDIELPPAPGGRWYDQFGPETAKQFTAGDSAAVLYRVAIEDRGREVTCLVAAIPVEKITDPPEDKSFVMAYGNYQPGTGSVHVSWREQDTVYVCIADNATDLSTLHRFVGGAAA